MELATRAGQEARSADEVAADHAHRRDERRFLRVEQEEARAVFRVPDLESVQGVLPAGVVGRSRSWNRVLDRSVGVAARAELGRMAPSLAKSCTW